MELTLHIVLIKPPTGVDFGLQKGGGNTYETIQTQTSDGGDMHFTLSIQIKGDRPKGEEPKFAGPFVQGQVPDKFLYIDIGQYAGQADGYSRRLKIPLRGINWDMIDKATGLTGNGLETRVPGTAKDGGPNCATVKPFEGWVVKNI